LEAQMALHVAMMLHELGTNASKYGALSGSAGWVTVGWTIENRTLRLRWEERGGPPAVFPTKTGFGTTLIEQSTKGQGGNARMSASADGIVWDIELPLPTVPSPALRVIDVVKSEPSRRTFEMAQPASGRLAGKRFLIVEDEPLVALDTASGLEEAGAEIVSSTGSSKDALEIIEHTTLDAALLDGNLHGHPVDTIAAALTRRRVPFLFLSGYGRESLPQAFRHTSLLSKPFSQRQLVDACARLFADNDSIVRLREK
jgi:CheY-like chemotaxis protein